MAKTVWRRNGERSKKRLQYLDCGLDDVYLTSGYEEVPSKHGKLIVVHDLEGLHAAIAEWLVQERKALRPKEARFLRKQLDLSQSQLALLLDVDVQTVARWEKGETQMSGPADRLLRTIFLARNEHGDKIEDMLDRLVKLDASLNGEMTFTVEGPNDTWRATG